MGSNSSFMAITQEARALLEIPLSPENYVPIDLSIRNEMLKSLDLTNPLEHQSFIDSHLHSHNAKVAYGGYLEERGLYAERTLFESGRNIHLGLDLWAPAGTAVLCPFEGSIHSFKNNVKQGDYGPTLILHHRWQGQTFYTLYGHLSIASMTDWRQGRSVLPGEVLGALGTPKENVGYAPHLHFQLVMDLQGMEGDYPGVCTREELSCHKLNCPDPEILLGWSSSFS